MGMLELGDEAVPEATADPELDETQPIGPTELAREEQQTATVGWTKRYIRRHYRLCPVARTVRRFVRLGYVAIGVMLTLHVGYALFGKAIIREAVEEALAKKHQQASIATFVNGAVAATERP
jgi:hypothetical protein